MNSKTKSKCYSDWRRSEAYQVPMTEEGMRKADERFNEFKKGWQYGAKYALFLIEQAHKENKQDHNFYLKLVEQIRGEFK